MSYCSMCKTLIRGTVYTEGDKMLCLSCLDQKASLRKWEKPYTDTPDMVNKPPHYNQAGIECIDAMQAMAEGATVSPHQAYCWQNSFKYLWRWPYKNGLQDLQKARWYLDRLITDMEKNNADG